MNIIAIGGGGFTHGTDEVLESYMLSTVQTCQPKIGFLGTASGDSDIKVSRFYDRFKHECKPTHLSLFGHVSNIEEWVRVQDIIYVGGGNTKSMLAVWHAWELSALLQIALARGTTLVGVSAGAACWFDNALSDSGGSGLQPMPCLAFLSGSCCPHFDEEQTPRRKVFSDLIGSENLAAGIGIDDGVAVHYRNGKVVKVVSARAQATAYLVEAKGGVSSITPLAETSFAHKS